MNSDSEPDMTPGAVMENEDASEEDEISEPMCDLNEPRNMNSREKDWATIADDLRRPRTWIDTDVFGAEFMQIPDDLIFTMDAVSKCWKTIPSDSMSLLTDETDGGSWAFCEPCVAQLPKMLQTFIYFFHILAASIDDLKFFAVPSKHVSLRRKRGERSKINDMIWHKPYEPEPRGRAADESDELDMNEMMCERGRNNARSQSSTARVAPFKVRLGFTGAVYRHKGEEHRNLVAVLVVTWARNWDMLGYIQDHVLRDPPKGSVNYKQRQQEVKSLGFIWKTMARFVAFDNLGLDETIVGMPEDYTDQPGGKLGRDSLFNLFQIPFQIFGIVKREVLERERRSDPKLTMKDIRIDRLDIVGLPRLSFKRDEITQDYVNYMQAFASNMSNERAGFAQALRQYYKPKDKKDAGDAGDGDETGDAIVANFDLACMGAWPLGREGGEYTKFGLPPLPLWLEFRPENAPEPGSTFDNWLADIGGSNGIPELTKTCLRSFLVQDLGATQESIWETWGHFLRDGRKANPSLVLREYYGANSDPLSSLVTAGHLRAWWVGVCKDIQAQRARGLSVADASQSLKRYLLSSSFYHKSSIHAGSFRSQRILQAVNIIEKADYKRVCLEEPSGPEHQPCSILAMVHMLTGTVSNDRRFDPYVRCNEAFYHCFELLNKDFTMNSSNLEFMIEIMISQLLWMIGPNNDTVVGYFQGMQQMAGNGHFLLTTKEGTFPDTRKPNSTGMDWSHGRLTELYQMLLDIQGIMDPKQNLQTPLNCMGWTPASIPLMTMATVTDGRIESLPDPTMGLRSIIATELRGDNINALIRGVFPRNSDGNESFMLNSADPNNTNMRKTQIKRRFTDLQFVAMSTNVANTTAESAEMTKTLSTVLQVMPPGSGPSTKKRKTGPFNEVSCALYGGRQSKPKNAEGIANLLPFTHIWCTAIPALMNKTSVVSTEISPTTIALLDWIFFYTRENTEGMLHKSVAESFRRMKDGYEARQVAKALWIKSIMFLSESDSSDQATERMLQSMFTNALPGHEAIACAHSFLTRGLHMGALLMIACIAKHLEVPIISVDSLRRFFDADAGEPETPDERYTQDTIRNWIVKCINNNRLCPENPGPTQVNQNISMYITSDGDFEGMPTSDKDSMLRVKRTKTPAQDEVNQAVGKRIKELWGRPLFETCHMGPEQSVYSNAITDLMTQWLPDCRQLISPHVFESRRHLVKLGLYALVPGITDWPADAERPPQFARSFAIYPQGGQEPTAMCVGVHAFALLMCVSLAGAPTLHPKISSNMARNILKEIMRHSPSCATPGNNTLVRSFNLHTTMAERVLIPKQARPKHFPRPTDDWNFASSGRFTFCRAIGRFLPEDAMHCGALFRYADLYCCDILELPAREIQVEYELLAGTHYSVWRERDSAFGTVFVSPKHEVVNVRLTLEEGEEEGVDLGYHEWQEGLRRRELLITPMIWRLGACIEVLLQNGGREVACIVPKPDSADNSMFCPNTCSYWALARPNTPPKDMHFLKVLKRLIPVGTEVFVKLKSPGVEALSLQVLRTERSREYLSGRLNVPTVEDPLPGKIYVTCMQKPILARSEASDMTCLTLVLDPWDVALDIKEGEPVCKFLVNAA